MGFNPPATSCWGIFMAIRAPVSHLLHQWSWEIAELQLHGWEMGQTKPSFPTTPRGPMGNTLVVLPAAQVGLVRGVEVKESCPLVLLSSCCTPRRKRLALGCSVLQHPRLFGGQSQKRISLHSQVFSPSIRTTLQL